ncbi:MAG: hypothetical protein JNM64_11125 [Chloroflexia bacterium]|nr:hypothetical protein [Chloroflexia bacterium]
MRRVVLIVALLTLALAPTLARSPQVNAQPAPCSRITTPDTWWFGVCEPVKLTGAEIANPIRGLEFLEGYAVEFIDENAVSNPFLEQTEFMVVRVRSGEFVMDIGARQFLESDGATPSPDNEQAISVLLVSADPVNTYGRTFVSSTEIEYDFASVYTPDGADCTVGCPIDPSIAVGVNAGDLIFVPEGTTCLWCLINAATAQVANAPAFESGVLETYIVTNNRGGFSWVGDWAEHAQLETDQTTTGSLKAAPQGQSRFAWAFNPGSNCRGG